MIDTKYYVRENTRTINMPVFSPVLSSGSDVISTCGNVAYTITNDPDVLPYSAVTLVTSANTPIITL